MPKMHSKRELGQSLMIITAYEQNNTLFHTLRKGNTNKRYFDTADTSIELVRIA